MFKALATAFAVLLSGSLVASISLHAMEIGSSTRWQVPIRTSILYYCWRSQKVLEDAGTPMTLPQRFISFS